MSFLEKFLIISKLEVTETLSFRAQDTLTGAAVLLHQLLPGQAPPRQPDLAILVFQHLPGTGIPGTENILEIGQEEDRVFVVTRDMPECEDLRGWLLSIAGTQETAGAGAWPAGAATEADEGFPTLGASPQPPAAAGGAVAAPAPDASWAEAPTPAPGGHEQPGEFTRMFSNQEPVAPTASSGYAAPQAPSVPPPLTTRENRGEFRFTSPNAPWAGGGTPESPGTKGDASARPFDKGGREPVPSGFQVVYQSRKQTPSPGASPEPAMPPSAPPPPNQAQGPGEFTQMFSGAGKEKATPAPPTPPGRAPIMPQAPQSEAPGEFTQMFASAGKGQSAPSSPSAPHAPANATPSSGQGEAPGEFTQMFQSVGRGQAPAAPSPTPSGPGISPQPPADIIAHTDAPTVIAPVSAGGGMNRPTPPPASVPESPGEFTAMFNSPDARVGSPGVPPPPPASVPLPSVSPSASAGAKPVSFSAAQGDSAGPGEFTQMFKSGGASASGPRPSGIGGPQASAPLPGAPKQEPGELTALMQGYKPATGSAAPPASLDAPAKPTAPAPAAGGKSEPGEFTMLFRQPPPSPAPQVVAPPGPVQLTPQAAAPPPPRQAGDYTSLFESPRRPAVPAAGTSQAASPAGYAYPAPPQPPAAPGAPPMPSYQAPAKPAYPAAPPPQYQPPAPAYAAPPPPAAPQMQPMAAPAPPAVQPAPPPAKKPAKLLIPLLILGGLFLLAVALIVFFALKH